MLCSIINYFRLSLFDVNPFIFALNNTQGLVLYLIHLCYLFFLPPRLTRFLLVTLELVCNGLTLIPDLADLDLKLLHTIVLEHLLMETEVEEAVGMLEIEHGALEPACEYP